MVLERWAKCFNEEKERSLLPELCEEVLPELDDYVKACIRLSWRMVTQVPPMHLEYSSSRFNKKLHKLTRLSYNTESNELHTSENIACYLWPALLEQGGRVIFHGEVLCKPACF